MGDPVSPTQEQYHELKKAAELPPPHTEALKNDAITLSLPPKSLFLVEVR
jgi:hypothetical protein